MEDFSIEQVNLTKIPIFLKLFFTMFLIMIGTGYIFADINIHARMGINAEKIVKHYRGDPNDQIGFPAKDFATLASTSHTHFFGMSLVFFCLGIIFIFTRTLPLWLKTFVLVYSFLGVMVGMGCMWMIRYVTPGAAYVMMGSGMIMGMCCLIEIATPLYEMWLKRA